jgi:hypothetical protein
VGGAGFISIEIMHTVLIDVIRFDKLKNVNKQIAIK